MSLKNSNDTIGNRTRDLPVCSVVLLYNGYNCKIHIEIKNNAKFQCESLKETE